MIRYTSLTKYKRHLLRELGPIDRETKACVLFDIEEHLGLMVKDIMNGDGRMSKGMAFHQAVESFGYPSDIAEAYRAHY